MGFYSGGSICSRTLVKWYDTSKYWAAVFRKRDTPEEEPSPFSSRGTWETPVEALSDAYARYTASKYKPISEQMGFTPRRPKNQRLSL